MNHASKFRRSKKVRRTDPLPDQLGPRSGDESYAASSPAAAVESKVDVMQMLQTLSIEHREVIVLRELQQMSYEEISEALRIPRGTVESRLHRARQELKRRYEGYLS
jgi:RNA polymerase sigma-70 factor (ECF subfamily)